MKNVNLKQTIQASTLAFSLAACTVQNYTIPEKFDALKRQASVEREHIITAQYQGDVEGLTRNRRELAETDAELCAQGESIVVWYTTNRGIEGARVQANIDIVRTENALALNTLFSVCSYQVQRQ